MNGSPSTIRFRQLLSGQILTKNQVIILPDSDKKHYSEDDLKDLSKEELRIARNEIYARHGRKFKSNDLQRYFEEKDWYHAEKDEVVDTELNETEIANRDLIVKLEEN